MGRQFPRCSCLFGGFTMYMALPAGVVQSNSKLDSKLSPIALWVSVPIVQTQLHRVYTEFEEAPGQSNSLDLPESSSC